MSDALKNQGTSHGASPLLVVLGSELQAGHLASLREVLKTIREHKMNVTLFHVMLVLYLKRGMELDHTYLADEVGVGSANITAVADTLVERGLAVRKSAAGDRRRNLLELSPEGFDFLRDLEGLFFPCGSIG